MPKHLLCTWCKEVLNSTDTIFSTFCGHIFHFGCMRQFQSQSTSCPECSYNNPGTHEMFLFFEKCRDENVSNNGNYKLKIIELHKEIEEGKNNFLHLQEKYSVSQDLVQKLEEKGRISNNGILQRTAIISDLEDRIKVLDELNQFLTTDNDSLTLKSKEIHELKNSLVKNDNGATETNLSKETPKALERKMEKQSTVIHDDMENCSQLSVDKTNLQKYINLSTLDPVINGTAKSYSYGKTMTPESRNNVNTNAGFQNMTEKRISRGETEDYSVTSILERLNENDRLISTHPQHNSNSSTGNSIFIKNFPKKDLIYPLKNVILTFVATKEGAVLEDDITKVYVKDSCKKKVTLFVQFKNRDLKNKFLLNRDHIQQLSPSLELIEINKYNEGIKGTPKSYSDGKTMISNSSENIGKVSCTVGYQNVLEKQVKPRDDLTTLDPLINGTAKSYSDTKTMTPKSRENVNTKVDFQNVPEKKMFLRDKSDYFVTSISDCSIDSNSLSCTQPKDNFNSFTDNILYIKNFPKQDLTYPLKKMILTFVATKEGYVSEDDITEVYVKDGNGKSYSQLPKKVIIVVQFKNRDLKNKFLLNQAYIQQLSPSLELIETPKSYSDGKTMISNSSENIGTKVSCTVGYQNVLEKQFKPRDDFSTLDPVNNGTAKSYSDLKTMPPHTRENVNTKIGFQNVTEKKMLSRDAFENYSVTSISEFSNKNDILICIHPQDNTNSTTGNCVLIKNVPKNELTYPLKKFIFKFVVTKQGYVSEDDITKVYVKDGYKKSYSELPNKVTMFVQFKNRDLRNKFLLNQALIQQLFPSRKAMISNSNENIDIKVGCTVGYQNVVEKQIKPRYDLCSLDPVINERANSYSDAKSMTPKSRENVNTKVGFQRVPKKKVKNKFPLNQAEMQKESLELFECDKHKQNINEELLKYAKQKLNGNGFNYIFCQNDEVMALTDRSDTEGIRIRNKSHVNKLSTFKKKN